MGLFLDKIKFDKWFHIGPLFAIMASFIIENSKLRASIMIIGALICFVGIWHKELKKK